MSSTLTTAAGLLKEVYEEEVRDQTVKEAVTIKRITRTAENIMETAGGKYVVFPVRKHRNEGISYRPENTRLGNARKAGYSQAQETLRYGYGRIRITGQLMELANSKPKAFINAVDDEVSGMKDGLIRDSNRIAVGNRSAFAIVGATGILARSTGSSTGTSITVADTSFISLDMCVDLVDNSGVPVAGGTERIVTSITSDTVFVVDSAVAGVVSGTNVVRSGNFNNEPYGVLNLIGDSGTIHGINSGTAGNEWWKSYADSSTTTLTEPAMIANCDRIRKKGGGHITAIFASLGVRRAYFNLMTSLRRYNEPKEFVGGLVGLSFNYEKEVPFVSDIDYPASTMALINEDEFSVYRPREWYWADDDGQMLKWVSDYDSWEALMKQYWQIVCHRRNGHAIMTTVTEA